MPPAKRHTSRRSSEHTSAHQNISTDQASAPTDPEHTSPKLREELKVAGEAFREQEKFIRDLDREATHHEKIIWQQQREIVRLQKVEAQQEAELVGFRNREAQQQMELERLRKERREVPHTAATDLAGVLSTANHNMTQEIHALREHNAYLAAQANFLERERAGASMMLANAYRAHMAQQQELGRKDQFIGALLEQVEQLKTALRRVIS